MRRTKSNKKIDVSNMKKAKTYTVKSQAIFLTISKKYAILTNAYLTLRTKRYQSMTTMICFQSWNT